MTVAGPARAGDWKGRRGAGRGVAAQAVMAMALLTGPGRSSFAFCTLRLLGGWGEAGRRRPLPFQRLGASQPSPRCPQLGHQQQPQPQQQQEQRRGIGCLLGASMFSSGGSRSRGVMGMHGGGATGAASVLAVVAPGPGGGAVARTNSSSSSSSVSVSAPRWVLSGPPYPATPRAAVSLASEWLSLYDVFDATRSAEELLAKAAGFPSSRDMMLSLGDAYHTAAPAAAGGAGGEGREGAGGKEEAAGAAGMSEEQWADFAGLCSRRALHEPVQYIVGEWDFHLITLKMEAPILIPRPETEELVEMLLPPLQDLIHARQARQASSSSTPTTPTTTTTTTSTTNTPTATTTTTAHGSGDATLRLLDVGSGTGAIGLALLSALPPSGRSDPRGTAVVRVEAEAIDPHPTAIRLALQNAQDLGLGDRYTCLQQTMREYAAARDEWGVEDGAEVEGSFNDSDQSKAQQQQQQQQQRGGESFRVEEEKEEKSNPKLFDLIVSNPPYIPEADMIGLDADVSHYEDHGALCGGQDGLDVVRDILAAAPRLLRADGLRQVWMEVDTSHPEALGEDGALPAAVKRYEWFNDLCGKPRFVKFTF